MSEISMFCWFCAALFVAYGLSKDRRFVLLGISMLLLGFAVLVQHRAIWLCFVLTTVAAVLITIGFVQHFRAQREMRKDR